MHVILVIAPSSIELCICRARAVIASEQKFFDQSEWPSDLNASLHDRRSILAEMAGRLNAARWPTIIVATLPGGFTSVQACPAAAGHATALQSARLALANLVTFPLAKNPHEVVELHTDADGSNVRQRHTLAMAESEERVAVVSRWATEAGLTVTGVVSVSAVLTATAVRLAIESEHPKAVLCIGEHDSVLTIGGAGRLSLVRPIAAGTETLAEALTRPLRPTGGGELVTLTRAAAREALGKVGVPALTDSIPGAEGCDGASALPLLQPALQRLAVEVKQSLRFGVDEQTRGSVTLALGGPGAVVSNLASVLARQSGLSTGVESPSPCGASVGRLAAECIHQLPTLLSSEARDRGATRGLRRALLAGVAAAAALLMVQGVGVRLSLAQERARIQAMESSSRGSQAMQSLQDAATDRAHAAGSLARRVEKTMGTGTAHAAVLELLASKLPEAARLLEVAIESQDGGPICRLRGYVRLESSKDAATEIRGFIDTLAIDPLVESVRLGVTQRAEIRGRPSQTFELTVRLVALPSVGLTRTAVEPSAGGEHP